MDRARHVVTNGYANGWLIDGVGQADLTIRYQPDRWVNKAAIISLLGAIAALAALADGPTRRLARDHHRSRL